MSRLLRTSLFLLLGLLAALALVLAGFRGAAYMRETHMRQFAAPPTGRFVQAADVQMYVQEVGPADGLPLLFIPGVGGWSETWRPTMQALGKAGYRCIAVDVPPFGYSERPADASYGSQQQARRIVGVLDALDLHRVVLIGHSFGGRVAMEAALAAPQRLRALVLVDAPLALRGTDGGGVARTLRAALAIGPVRDALVAATATNPVLTKQFLELSTVRHDQLTAERIEVYRRPLALEGTTEAMGQWAHAFLHAGDRSRSAQSVAYRGVRLPTLVIWGDLDPLTPLAQGEQLARLLPQARLEVLKGVGHIPQLEDNASFNQAVLTFLNAQEH
jgi:pimeloyl-ACP methyl ester carboxylesterase